MQSSPTSRPNGWQSTLVIFLTVYFWMHLALERGCSEKVSAHAKIGNPDQLIAVRSANLPSWNRLHNLLNQAAVWFIPPAHFLPRRMRGSLLVFWINIRNLILKQSGSYLD